MELRHLRYFVAVALELHMGRAARRLFISQPALSQQVRGLEHELGLRLLQRNRRGVRLTPEGEAFLAEARAVVQQADHALEVARALSEGATGHLRMSYVLTTPGGLPELIVSEYQRRYPGVQISFDSGSTAQNLERLRRGEVDVAFAHNAAEDNADLGWIEIGTQPLMVALPSAHPLVAVSEGVGVTLLLEERAAMLGRPGVTFRRFTEPEPSVALGVAFPQPPFLAARRFLELAQELGREPRLSERQRL